MLARDVLDRLQAGYGDRLLPMVVRQTVRAQEAFAHCQPLTRFAPGHPVTEDVERLATDLEEGVEHEQRCARAAS